MISRLLLNAPPTLMLGALIYAPWAYGATRPWAVVGLNYLLGAVVVLWLASYLLRQTWPSVHPVLLVAAVGLTAQAWFMVFNAKYDYDAVTHEFISLTPLFPWAPGSVHQARSFETATQLSAVLAALCVVCDMARSSTWRA